MRVIFHELLKIQILTNSIIADISLSDFDEDKGYSKVSSIIPI